MIAYCGLNCATCGAYLATRDNDDQKREETARNWSKIYRTDIRPEQVNCNGCKADGVKFFHCSVCEIRQCCILNEAENCADCGNYICDTLAEFIQLAPEAGKALEKLRD